MLIDTHAHLNFPDFQKDLDQVVKRSLKEGVAKIICVSSNLEDSQKAISLAQKYPQTIFASIGIHPHQTDPKNRLTLEKQILLLEKLADQKNVVAIGECGLDFSSAPPFEKDRSKKEQIFLFQKQIKIAQNHHLPLIVHSRKAFPDTVRVIESFTHNSPLKNHNRLSGVFHCYAAGKKGIDVVNRLNFYFGVDGNLTYDEGLQIVFSQITLEKILLETDAPFLSPTPWRGQRNEPSHIKIIAQSLASFHRQPYEIIAQKTTANAQKLFSLK